MCVMDENCVHQKWIQMNYYDVMQLLLNLKINVIYKSSMIQLLLIKQNISVINTKSIHKVPPDYYIKIILGQKVKVQ